jgi:tubulin--tyrosine ligase-like protein 12
MDLSVPLQAYGSPAWMQPTYNMETQLPALIGDYLARQEKKQDNLWIVKPWNMARTIDTTVTGSLPALLRLVETGPKICQKYIEKPALYQGRKFDLRYIVLLRSIQPLEIFLSDVFWVSSVFQVLPRNVEQVFLLVFLSGGQVYCLLLHD